MNAKLSLLGILGAASLLGCGCAEKTIPPAPGPAERTGAAIDRAAEKTADAAKAAAEATKNATGRAVEKTGEVLKKAGTAVDKAGSNMQK